MPIELTLQPPKEAVDAFAARGLLVTGSWQSLWQEEHAKAFTVANLAKMDLLQEIHSAVGQAIQEGQDYRTFAKGLVPKLQAAGWWNQPVPDGKPLTPSRLQLIYDANLRVSYSASQWQRIQTLKRIKPYLRYSTMKDARVREMHREWEGITLPVDHPWWDAHFPPNGWRCRCRPVQLSLKDIEQEGGAITPDEALPTGTKTFTNRVTGEVTTVPAGIDPGWAYNPGNAAWENLGQIVGQKIVASDPRLAAEVVQAAGTAFTRPLTKRLEQWVRQMQENNLLATGNQVVVGAMEPDVLDFLATKGVGPESAAITLSDREFKHGRRPKKAEERTASWSVEMLLDLPELLIHPPAIYWDTEDPALIYAWPAQEKVAKAVIHVDYRVQSARKKIRTNIIKTTGLVAPEDLEVNRYQRIR